MPTTLNPSVCPQQPINQAWLEHTCNPRAREVGAGGSSEAHVILDYITSSRVLFLSTVAICPKSQSNRAKLSMPSFKETRECMGEVSTEEAHQHQGGISSFCSRTLARCPPVLQQDSLTGLPSHREDVKGGTALCATRTKSQEEPSSHCRLQSAWHCARGLLNLP